MSSDTDHPRQRTVAELLAENGGASSGRRRRRRDADGPDEVAATADRWAPSTAPPETSDTGRRSRHRDAGEPDARRAPVRPLRQEPPPERPRPRLGYEPAPPAPPDTWAGRFAPEAPEAPPRRANGFGSGADTPQPPPAGYAPRRDPGGPDTSRDPAREPGRDPMTEVRRAAFDGHRTVPEVRPVPLNGRPAPDAPAGRYGARPAAPGRPVAPEPRSPLADPHAPAPRPAVPEARPEQPRTERSPWAPDRHTEQLPRIRRDGPAPLDADDDTGPIATAPAVADDDGGPPTMLGAPPLADDDLDAGPATEAAPFPPALDDELDDQDAGSATTAVAPVGRRPLPDRPAGLDDLDDLDDLEPGSSAAGARRARADDVDHDLDEDDARPQAWAAVVGQWLAGAIVGAGLWVGFRYLWFNLPVVALAAAVVVTVALVLGVRALLRNDDLRTTIFAVLVGLLLTVSPAILVLLGR